MLSDSLKVLHATNFAFYLKSHGFHWNVCGPDFAQLHKFFQDISDDVYGAVDLIAEYIRSLDEFAPASFERFSELSVIKGQTKIPRARLMIEELLANNGQMVELLNHCFIEATKENQQGVTNFISDRLTQHGKWGWQLSSFLKDERA